MLVNKTFMRDNQNLGIRSKNFKQDFTNKTHKKSKLAHSKVLENQTNNIKK